METNRLSNEFNLFVSAIIEKLKLPVGIQGFTQTAETIEGLGLEDLKNLIRDALYLHLHEENAHNLTFDQLGGLSRQTIMGIMGSVQIANIIPISKVDLTSFNFYEVDWVAGTMNLSTFHYLFNGQRRLNWKLNSLTIPPGKVSVLTLTVSPESTDNDVVTLEDHYYPDMLKIPLGVVNPINKTITFYNITKVGEYVLSKTPKGASIPISDQLNETVGSLNQGWK